MLYVIRVVNGLQEIYPDAPFYTHLLKLNEDELDHHTPKGSKARLSKGDVIEHHLNHAQNSFDLWNDEDFERYQVIKVPEPAVPVGRVLTGYYFTDTDGVVEAHALHEEMPPLDQLPVHQVMLQLTKMYRIEKLEETVYERLMNYLPTAPMNVQIYWKHSHMIERNHPSVKAVFIDAFEYGQSWIDQMFRDASQHS